MEWQILPKEQTRRRKHKTWVPEHRVFVGTLAKGEPKRIDSSSDGKIASARAKPSTFFFFLFFAWLPAMCLTLRSRVLLGKLILS